MDKILFISNYMESSGWGQAGRHWLASLAEAGLDVAARPLFYNGNRQTVCESIKKLQDKSSKGCKVNIQHCLPHLCRYNGHFDKNICLFVSETSHFRNSSWPDKLNLMDEVWVGCKQQLKACKDSGVTVPLFVWPHTFNTDVFERSYKEYELLKPFKDNGDFIFYSIGEINKRKNIEAMLKAFYLEFDYDENVQLVLKANKSGHDRDGILKAAREISESVKTGLKLYGPNSTKYKPVPILADRVTDEEILSLHTTCDCYLNTSYGEACGIETFVSMGLGKTPVAANCGGIPDYLSDDEGWLVNVNEEPVFGYTETFNDICVGNENWWSVDINNLRKKMREAYTNKQKRESKAKAGRKRVYDFSYSEIGNLAKKRLENGCETFSRIEGGSTHELAGTA